jgi:formylglycine-generating enzyme required for sulfatase activity
MVRVDSPLANLFIAKYPTTNLEYGEFVKAGGYSEREWWSESAWKWRVDGGVETPRYWHDRINRPNHPVVGISLFEAVAYCRWLTKKRNGAYEFRLPTGPEWLSAAGFMHPQFAEWGLQLQDRINAMTTAKSRALLEQVLEAFRKGLRDYLPQLQYQATTPVGVFPANAHGIHDLLGNVWEWCDESEDGHRASAEWNPERLPALVKGGPSDDGLNDSRVITGGSFDPFVRFHKIGFRICCNAV